MIMLCKTPMLQIETRSSKSIITQRKSLKRTVKSYKVKLVQIVWSPTLTRNCCQSWLSKQGLIMLSKDRNKHQLIRLCFRQFKRQIFVRIITPALQSSKLYRQPTLPWRQEARARKPTESSLPCQRHLFRSQIRTKSSSWETCQQLSTTVTSQPSANETSRIYSSRNIASECPSVSEQLSIIHQWIHLAKRCLQG